MTDQELELLSYTYERAAELVGVCRETIERLVKRGELSVTYVTPDAPRIRHHDLSEYLASRRKQATRSRPVTKAKPLARQRRPAVIGPRPG